MITTRQNELRDRAETYVRENPAAAILGAIGIGFAVGLLIRAVELSNERTKIKVNAQPLNKAAAGLKLLALPLIVPVLKGGFRKFLLPKMMKSAVRKAKSFDVSDVIGIARSLLKKSAKFGRCSGGL